MTAVVLTVTILLVQWPGSVGAQPDPLPSWSDRPAEQSIVRFVQAVTDRETWIVDAVLIDPTAGQEVQR